MAEVLTVLHAILRGGKEWPGWLMLCGWCCMARDCTVEIFLKDIAAHEMTVSLDSGIYRHLKFRAKEHGWNLWFELVTWPGRLTINGDMGTWTFSRLDDMFKFFRSSAGLKINASYWAEKLQHGVHGGTDSSKVWDDDRFRKELLSQLTGYGLESDDLAIVTEELKEDVLCHDGEWEMMTAARDFSCALPNRGGERNRKFEFEACELPDGKDYSYHFIWCLYANRVGDSAVGCAVSGARDRARSRRRQRRS